MTHRPAANRTSRPTAAAARQPAPGPPVNVRTCAAISALDARRKIPSRSRLTPVKLCARRKARLGGMDRSAGGRGKRALRDQKHLRAADGGHGAGEYLEMQMRPTSGIAAGKDG